jgi:hypothetical protein
MPYQMCYYCLKNVEEKSVFKIPPLPIKNTLTSSYTTTDENLGPASTEYAWTFVCTACYFDRYCIFCNPPELRENCPGHGITLKKGNRFSEDKKFTKEMIFDEDK